MLLRGISDIGRRIFFLILFYRCLYILVYYRHAARIATSRFITRQLADARARWLSGFYTLIAVALFVGAAAAPSCARAVIGGVLSLLMHSSLVILTSLPSRRR